MAVHWGGRGPGHMSRNTAPNFDPRILFAAGEQGFWLDPSDFSTMFQDAAGATPVTAVGQSVRLMLDKSGKVNNFTQSSTSNAPILQQDASGRYFLLFDGTDDWLQSSSTLDLSGTDKVTACIGVRKLSDASTFVVLENTTASGSFRFFNLAGSASWTFGSTGTISRDIGPALTYSAPITNVLTGLGDISGDLAQLRINGDVSGTNALDQGTGNYGNYTTYIGRRSGTSFPFSGRLYQAVVRGALTSGADLARLETFVNQKTGAY